MSTRATRHGFLTGAASIFATIGYVRDASAAPQFEYKFGHDQPLGHPIHAASVEMWRSVERETQGRLRVQVFPANMLGSDTATLTQIRSGATQFAALSGAIISAVVPVTGMESLPFAFKDSRTVYAAMDGPLGALMRREMEAKEIGCLPYMYAHGFRDVTASTHPIRVADDFVNFKIRIPPSKIFVDAFSTLGASPASISTPEVYTALQTHIVDGQEQPLSGVEAFRFYEVQKYLSITNHMWTGFWVVANTAAWTALPADIQAAVLRNQKKYALQERRAVEFLSNSLADKLARRGMIVNTADTVTFKNKLQPFYARWKKEFGEGPWTLLEQAVGKVG